jgi:hypothetical protein
MMISADLQVSWFTEKWNRTPDSIPDFQFSYSCQEKKRRENIASGFYDRLNKMKETLKRGMKKPEADSLLADLNRFLSEVYDFPAIAKDLIINRQFFDVSKDFFKKARAFDESLTKEEIYQALRNVWIMNGIQMMMDLPVTLTPSIFAYSLLYPYSDNLLDDPGLSETDKKQFCARFADMIKGKAVDLCDSREEKIRNLLGMIENQYDRSQFPEVFESLLAIHEAQTRSIALQKDSDRLITREVIELSFAKGGTSVLADGYLVAGKLTPLQQRFLFGYGIWLQLADDIQDIAEDRAEQVRTLFTPASSNGNGIAAFNRSVNFGRLIIPDITGFPAANCSVFGQLMVHAVETMMLQSAGTSGEPFSDSFINTLEQYSPLHFEFLKDMRRKGNATRMGLVTSVI